MSFRNRFPELTALSLLLLAAVLPGCAPLFETPTPLPPPAPVQEAVQASPQPTSLAVPQVNTATPLPTATATALPTATTPPLRRYRVAYVLEGDQLNVRTGPGVDYGVVGAIPPNLAGVQSTSPTDVDWIQISWQNLNGWVNRYFLTEDVGSDAFCTAPEARRVVDDFSRALQARDGQQLAQLVHPRRGLLVRLNWWNKEVRFGQPDVATLFTSATSYDWGFEDGSGLAIQGPFKEVVLPILDRDFGAISQITCNSIASGGSAGIIQLPFEYSPVNYYSVFRAAPPETEFDWGTWVLGIEYWAGRPYLSFLVHYQWEI